jgi:hypothetical protein
MTPFMQSVQALLDGGPAPRAGTVPSEPGPVPNATDIQVIVRSLAEQLVSEANAVLREYGDLISLDDHVGPGGLTFVLGYQDRSACVQTTMAGRSALVQLVLDGQPEDQPRRLSGEDELQALVLSLIAARPQLPARPQH